MRQACQSLGAKETATAKRPPVTSALAEILHALHESRGCGHYSRFPLSLASGKITDWNWPSVDHLKGLEVAELVLETRLVNDMKTIMSDEEFRTLIGHLAAVLKVKVKEQETWQCRRSFAIEE